MAAASTPGQLAAELVVHACLPAVVGAPQGKVSVPGAPLAPEQRAALGLRGAGATFHHACGQQGVFFDLTETLFTVWFSGDDCEQGPSLLESAFSAAKTRVRRLKEMDDPRARNVKVRVYEADLTPNRSALIEISFPTHGAAGDARKFTARIEPRTRAA
jgi:hypothetical protein